MIYIAIPFNRRIVSLLILEYRYEVPCSTAGFEKGNLWKIPRVKSVFKGLVKKFDADGC